MKLVVITALCTGAMVSLATSAQTIELPYESVFKDYQPHKEVKLKNWKVANEEVRAAGGWRAYQREAQAPDNPNPSPAAPLPTKTPSSSNDKVIPSTHQGHGK